MGSPQDLSLLLETEAGGHKEKEKGLKRRLRQMLQQKPPQEAAGLEPVAQRASRPTAKGQKSCNKRK